MEKMSKERAIEVLEADKREKQRTYDGFLKMGLDNPSYALDSIEAIDIAIESLSKTDGWISIEDRLPNEAFGCLIMVMEDDHNFEPQNVLFPYPVGYNKGDSQWIDGDGQQCPFEVTHWFELPNPPNEEVKPKTDLEKLKQVFDEIGVGYVYNRIVDGLAVFVPDDHDTICLKFNDDGSYKNKKGEKENV